MKKEPYIEAEIEIIRFITDDVLTGSIPGEDDEVSGVSP